MEPSEGREEPCRGMQQFWEAQWQEFLKTLQAPHSAWGTPQMSEATPWDDAKAFLASFEQVAEACQWPRAEWVAQLLPALSGEAQQAFSFLAVRDKEDYGKVKAAILRGDTLRREMQRQHFRQFCCHELGDPRRMYSQLQELCCLWLKPERRTKEQILELLILEQFLASLPVDVQSWIQAGGPDSGAQAVALLEEFLVSRRQADTGTWQEPLQEWAVGHLDVKEEPLDVVQREISKEQAERFRDTQQNINGEIAVPGIVIAHPTSLLPQEGQDMNEVELAKALGVQVEQVMNPRKMGVPLHMVEWTLMQSNQRPMFWNVLQEDGENVDSLEGSLGPRLGLDPHPVKKEETFLPDPVQSPRLPGQESGDREGTHLKVKNSQAGENEIVETPRKVRGKSQENVLVTVEANRGHVMEPRTGWKESDELTESLGTTYSDSSLMDTEGEKASLSKYARRYCPQSGLVFEHSEEDYSESPPLGEEIQPKSKLDKHHSSHIKEKNHDCPEFRVTLNSKSFVKRQIINTGEKTYRCMKCGKNFSRRSDLLRHEMIHTGKKPHQCPECGKTFSQKSTLLTHQMVHTGEKPHKCPYCGNKFSQRSALVTHQMIHTGKKPHQCPECGKNFSRRSTLFVHQSTHTGEKQHKCPTCGKGFSHRSSMLTHYMIHKGEKPHKCHTCGKSFAHRSSMLTHHMIHKGEKPHKCPNCGKSFSRRSSLITHQIIHTGIKPHHCPECGKTFSQRSKLLIHQMMHSGEKPHKCSDCGKSFSQRSDLSRHQNIHTGVKPHKCPSCGKNFSRRSNLLTHQMIHTGKKPYQCPECGKNFCRRSQLLIHEMIHTGEKPHKCPECGKSFSTKSDLIRHEMIHTGKKPHQCLECGKSFSQKSTLLTHLMIHTGEKPHKCPNCGKSFSRKSDLVSHQKTHTERKLTGALCVGKA